MARIFISHATEDDDTAGQVHEWLVEDGHETFLDHDLRAGIGLGEEWEQRLLERLRWADGVVCLVTSAYRTSAWCSAELGVARSACRPRHHPSHRPRPVGHRRGRGAHPHPGLGCRS